MDNTHICKICNRTFSSGKAMGGHMRSHLAKLPPKQNPTNNHIIPPSSPSSSSSTFEFPTTPSPLQSYLSLNIHHGARIDSSQKPKRARSQRKRKRVEDLSEQVSSITDDIFTEEDVAMCLVMLSMDKWTRMVKDNEKVVFDDIGEDNCYVAEHEDGESFKRTRVGSKAKTKYRCLLCNKVFKSYQALGGHKASHKRLKKKNDFENEEEFIKENDFEDDDEDIIEHKRMFKCPFCDKSFESGQALGGHKKIHFSYLDPISITTNYNYARSKCDRTKDLLDLNLPAPEDDGVVMQV